MKYAILNRRSGEVQFTAEIECAEDTMPSIKLGFAVNVAVKAGAILDGTCLIGARLIGARLDGARLDGAILDGAILDGASLVGASLVGASLVGARLIGARLIGARLIGAILDRARLDGAILDGALWDAEGVIKTTISPITFYGAQWPVTVFDGHIKIGCQVHTTEEWKNFDDEAIARMDGTNARKFWKQWKTAILALAKAHQSKVKKIVEGE